MTAEGGEAAIEMLGIYEMESGWKDVEAQKQGEIVWPEFDIDPENINGVERRGELGSALEHGSIDNTQRLEMFQAESKWGM